MIQTISTWLIDTIGSLGYSGLFVLMAIESSVFPLPSEVVMIPAGYLVQQGEMNGILVLFVSTLGSLFGAWMNYFFAFFVGRPFLLKYGKYFFVTEDHLLKTEAFFEHHGSIAVFIGRLLPVIRHLISLPAGLAKMNPVQFSAYTFFGAGIWNALLIGLGYFIGQNTTLIHEYLHWIILGVMVFVGLILLAYVGMKNQK